VPSAFVDNIGADADATAVALWAAIPDDNVGVTRGNGLRYAPGIGIAASASLLLMALLAIGGYGVSPPPIERAALRWT
jgi:hypothetical protein